MRRSATPSPRWTISKRASPSSRSAHCSVLSKVAARFRSAPGRDSNAANSFSTRWSVHPMVYNTFASAPPLRPSKLANSEFRSRNCSSIPARAKFSRRSIVSVAEQTPIPPAPSPLADKRVVITRAESQSAALAAALESQGAHVYSLPLIQILPPLDFAPLDAALRDLPNFDWLIFTSQNAVTAVADRLATIAPVNPISTPTRESVIPSEARNLSSANISSVASVRTAAVGKATAEAAQQAGFTVAHIGQGGTAATLVLELISELHEKRVLLPRSDRAASELVPRLQRFGAEVTEVIAYRTADTTSVDSASREAVAASDAILFFSPSAVHSFAG